MHIMNACIHRYIHLTSVHLSACRWSLGHIFDKSIWINSTLGWISLRTGAFGWKDCTTLLYAGYKVQTYWWQGGLQLLAFQMPSLWRYLLVQCPFLATHSQSRSWKEQQSLSFMFTLHFATHILIAIALWKNILMKLQNKNKQKNNFSLIPVAVN